jgi:hypothetical protein
MLQQILHPIGYLKWLKARSLKSFSKNKRVNTFLNKQKELSKSLPPINPNTDINKLYNNRNI